MSRPGGLSAEDRAALREAEERRRLRELEEAERRRREREQMQAEGLGSQEPRPRAEQRRDRGTITPRDMAGVPLEREQRRELLETVRPETDIGPDRRDLRESKRAREEAEGIRGTVSQEDLAYQQRVQEERDRLRQMREDPGRWTVETEPGSGEYRPLRGGDIDVRELGLAEYEAGYGEWRGSALGGAGELDVYAVGLMEGVETAREERGRRARDYEKALARWQEKAYMPAAKPRDAEAPKAGSARMYEEAMRFSETDVELLGGVLPVSSRGTRQIGAVLEGSLERYTTGITGMIPGRQPFEVMPGEEVVSAARTPYEGLEDPMRRNIAKVTGYAAEIGMGYVAFNAAASVAATGLGALGVSIGKLPFLGQRVASAASTVAKAINERKWLSSVLFGVPVLAGEGLKVKQLAERRTPLWEITAQLLGDVAALAGTAHGFSRGLAFGKTIPGRVERFVRGGTTIGEASFVPGYEGLPRFAEEPFPPNAAGYEDMARLYTPEELRIGAGIPSYHATAANIAGDFTVSPGVRPGEYGMFWSPAGSKHFLRLGGAYTWRPGVPNIFDEPRWLYGEFTDVAATGLSKASPGMQRLLERAAGTGELFMPVEQLSEAQALLSPSTRMVEVPGRFWAEMAEGPVRIGRYVPETVAAVLGFKGSGVTLDRLLAMSSAGKPSPSLYLPLSLLGFVPSSTSPDPLNLGRKYSRPGPPSYLSPELRPSSRAAPNSSILRPPRYAPPGSRVTPRKAPPSYAPPRKTPPSFTPPSRTPPSSMPPYRPPTYRPPTYKPPTYGPPGYRPPSRPPWMPPAMPRISPELGMVSSRRRGYKGERRTYPVRDPLSLVDELMSPPSKGSRRRRQKGGDRFGLF